MKLLYPCTKQFAVWMQNIRQLTNLGIFQRFLRPPEAQPCRRPVAEQRVGCIISAKKNIHTETEKEKERQSEGETDR